MPLFLRIGRHVLAVVVLPVTVVVLIPLWIARQAATEVAVPGSAAGWAAVACGAATLVLGSLLFATSLWRFEREGAGTLAPWDPPRHLVIGGPYAFVRNPMISGVVLLLISEGLLLRSSAHLAWAAGFFLLNAVYIPLLEEPRLRARFGEDYEEYARNVPRLVPRRSPWREKLGL